jgi:hypothetical protein
MRGNCSIKDCESNGMTIKIHEDFELAATDNNINICWRCGSKLLEAINEDNTAIEGVRAALSDTATDETGIST